MGSILLVVALALVNLAFFIADNSWWWNAMSFGFCTGIAVAIFIDRLV
jgi:hypothetical protein